MAFTPVIRDVSFLGHEWQELAELGLIVDGPTSTRVGYWTVRRPDELNLRAAWTFAK